MSQVGIVLKETYRRQVKAWSFLILVVSPFIFILISFGVGYLASSVGQDNDKVAIVTNDAALRHELQQDKDTVTTKYASSRQATKAVKDEKIKGYLKIEQKNERLTAAYHGVKHLTQDEKKVFLQVLSKKQQVLNIQKAKLTEEQVGLLAVQPQLEQKVKVSKEDQEAVKTISFMLLIFVMYFILITYTSATAQEIASEKGTKIMEIIFSSMPAQKYFYGKIGGMFCVIATQILIYIFGGGLIYSLAPRLEVSREIFNNNKELVDKVIANLGSLSLVYVILGVILFTVLAALCGALVVRPEDATKATQPALYIVMIGFFGALAFGQDPTNIVVKILSFIPFLSSFFMPIRIIDGSAGISQVVISLLILVISTFGLTAYVGKIYSGLILQTDDIGLFKSFKRGIRIK